MGKILSLDHGEKRVGVAISDEMKIIAIPLAVFDLDNVKEDLKKIIEEEEIEKIVVGLPRKMDGDLGDQAVKVQKFVKELEESLNFKQIEFEDETASSIEAERRLKERGINLRENRGEIDKESAVIILESYLKRENV